LEDSSALLLETLLSLFILLLAAKIGGELARRFNVAAVVGELLAGVLMAPTLLGGIVFMGNPLVVINEPVWVFAQVGAVLLLFLVGLETKFASFVKSGVIATVVALNLGARCRCHRNGSQAAAVPAGSCLVCQESG
jgi:Kef-type K+ transport system membrane component KefB